LNPLIGAQGILITKVLTLQVPKDLENLLMVQVLLILGQEFNKKLHMVRKLSKKTNLLDLLLPVMTGVVMIRESALQI